MAQGKSCQKSNADETQSQKAEEKKRGGGGTDSDQNKREEDDDLCPGIQMVNRALCLAVVVQKGMSHQVAVFSLFSISLEKLRPNIFSRSCFERPDPSNTR